MTNSTSSKPAPRKLTSLRLSEISLCARGANQHAAILLMKSAGLAAEQADIARRLDLLERGKLMDGAPARLLKALARRGAEMQAAARGERFIAPIEAIQLSKGASGGQQLVAAAVAIAKRYHDAQVVQRDQRHPTELRTAKTETPAERLIAAARARTAVMKRAG